MGPFSQFLSFCQGQHPVGSDCGLFECLLTSSLSSRSHKLLASQPPLRTFSSTGRDLCSGLACFCMSGSAYTVSLRILFFPHFVPSPECQSLFFFPSNSFKVCLPNWLDPHRLVISVTVYWPFPHGRSCHPIHLNSNFPSWYRCIPFSIPSSLLYK